MIKPNFVERSENRLKRRSLVFYQIL